MRAVDAHKVVERLDCLLGWCKELERKDTGQEPAQRYRAKLHADCLRQLLGDDPNAIVAGSGNSAATDYLRELRRLLDGWEEDLPGAAEQQHLTRYRKLILAADPPSAQAALFLGGCRYLVGSKVMRLDDSQSKVLEVLVKLGVANQKDLIDDSLLDDAPRILKQIRESYPELRPHIKMPGRRGQGGYSTTIRQADG